MKSSRHFTIRDILTSERIATQEELCEALRNRGYDVTQATVSRDIKELRLIKIPDETGYRYAFPENHGSKSSTERIKRVFRDSVVYLDYSENIIIIKTLPGTAQTVAAVVDAIENQNILGTVAGDDTMFILVKPKDAVESVLAAFRGLLED